MQINTISALNVRESPKFSRPLRNRCRGTRWWRQILDRKCAMHPAIIIGTVR